MKLKHRQKYILLLCVFLALAFLVGCNKKSQDQSQNTESATLDSSGETNNDLAENGTTEARAKNGLIIKSDNPIYTKSEVLEELNREVENLLKTLDSMDNIEDEDLDF